MLTVDSVTQTHSLQLLCLKAKAFSQQVMQTQMGLERWSCILTLTFGTTRTAELSALWVSRTLTLPFREFPWYWLLLNTEWTSVLLNTDRRIKSHEIFQGLHRKSNLGSPLLWLSASTNCSTTLHIACKYKIAKVSNEWLTTAPCLQLSNHQRYNGTD